jgi:hypothetical protein
MDPRELHQRGTHFRSMFPLPLLEQQALVSAALGTFRSATCSQTWLLGHLLT